jgi:hypothetical protein
MPGGRPTKLTPELQEQLCRAIGAGNYRKPACAFVGIAYATFLLWMSKGRKARRGRYFEFLCAVRKAEADAEVAVVALWRKSMPENPQEYRHFLTHRYPERWGVKDRLELTGKAGGPIRSKVSVADLSDQELHALIDRLLGVPGRPGRATNGRAPKEALPASPGEGRDGDDIIVDGDGRADA